MRYLSSIFAVLLLTAISFAAAPPYKVGSGNTVTADPRVPRPHTTPCVVELFKDAEFADYNPYAFSYTPPANCPGPWQKVVFVSNIYVTAGIQYDRTANFWMGSTNIYFGTTAEPSPNLSPNWVVEKDLTDYSPLFTTAQTGQADIGNTVNGTYTGIIYASAELEFYPIDNSVAPPPRPFDQVLPMSATPGTVALTDSTSTLAQTFTLPTNVEGAYLDVYAQSQNADEFWYTCVPNDVSGELESCGNTAFREGEITIDGTPAGVAPIYPWIYTGGIDPYLWFPLPGVQTLNFTPYRVNLTPFAGVLSNGQPHTVSLSVFNANNYFSATGTLLLYLDPNATDLAGAVTKNTLSAAPNPQVIENIKTGSNGDITGTVSVTSNRQFTISGYVTKPFGKVVSTVQQNINFSSVEGFDITSSTYVQNISQQTTIASTGTQRGGAATLSTSSQQNWPLSMDINVVVNSDGTETQTTTVRQENYADTTNQKNGVTAKNQVVDNLVNSTDALKIAGNSIVGNSGQASSQRYSILGSNGICYDITLTGANNLLTGVLDGCH
jgi:hypothetical protein